MAVGFVGRQAAEDGAQPDEHVVAGQRLGHDEGGAAQQAIVRPDDGFIAIPSEDRAEGGQAHGVATSRMADSMARAASRQGGPDAAPRAGCRW